MLLTICVVVVFLYAGMILLFAIAASRARYGTDHGYRPTVSIIIAARNEEENIGACLDSIAALTYPRELLDVVVVDDRSDDQTASIVRTFASRHPHIRLVTAEPGNGQLQGKTNAVTQGIESSHGEIILFTDADCSVPRGWAEETVKYYTGPDIGLVAGFTELQASRQFEEMQALDWFYLFSVAAGTIRINYPVTAVGNNLSVRRAAYEATGGYRKIPFSITEDYALFHAITSRRPFRARFPMDGMTLVQSKACRTWRELHRQKLRWFTGGRDMDLKSIAIFGLPYLLNVCILAGVFLFPLHIVLLSFGLKWAVDLALMYPALRTFRKVKLLRSLPLFEIYYFFYVLVYPLLVALSKRVVWKERSF